ncbi:MAG: response regulator transcription factor [Clostridia bacterium]|uniref:Stage 0 sporulation protein A homolog n=1 Tax=Desulforamulus aeronauticus DSM 10349 TaxID=1121421 RepID=A0A1M6X776_9FIRM|nr:response regulator transcription factor [Desulforamulus aeronauticus]MDA8210550.1 response regulator transcription factor [Clostridia bacterium]SHL01778.1 two-component system, OmpR family, response regulator ResD [Desulforamulus aeronauticus DSM 10349]
MKTILIADDEERIRELVRLYLEADGFIVCEAENGQQVLDIVNSKPIDLILLDLMMPVLDGWTVCKMLRRDKKIPIVMLTAKGEENDRVLGLDLGSDDYIVKPFSTRELVARVKAVLRRTEGNKDSDHTHTLSYPGLKINLLTRELEVNGESVNLTSKEFDLLATLAKNPGRIFSRDQLLEMVWGFDYCGDSRTVDTHINRVRSKLENPARNDEFIKTIRGVGYKFELSGH